MSLKKVLASVVVTLVLGAFFSVLVSVVVTDYIENKEASRAAELIEKELIGSGLISEKLTIERELIKLTDKEASRLPTVTFVLRKPKKAIYESIRPIMNVFGVRATIAISPDSMPGGGGNISVSQYKTLLGEGYSTAALYDGSEPLDSWLERLKTKCAAAGIAMPKVLYVCGGTEEEPYWLIEYDEKGKPIFTNELNLTLEAYQIKHVIHETYQTKIVAYQNFYEDFVYSEALGFNAMNSKAGRLASGSLYETVKNRAAVVYSLNFEFENNHGAFYGEYDNTLSAGDGTTTDDFARMLGAISQYGESLKITDILSVRDYRKELNESFGSDEETDELIERLVARLAEIELAIQAVKVKYT